MHVKLCTLGESTKPSRHSGTLKKKTHDSESFESDPTRDFHMECSLVRCEKNTSWMAVLHNPVLAFTRGRGLTLTSARVLVRAPVEGPGSQPTDIGDHCVCIPCSRAHFGRVTAACVSSPKRLGSLHRLTHAARHGHFYGASTPKRTASFAF